MSSPFPRKTRQNDPYADAPYLPGEYPEPVDLDAMFPVETSKSPLETSKSPAVTSKLPVVTSKSPTVTCGARVPIELEIGGGRGAFAYERLAFDPEVRLLGLEIRKKWATIVDRKLHALGLAARGRCFAEDARFALPRLRPSARLRAVFLHFPDPWWKKRHEKRLVMGDVVQTEIERLLEDGGHLFVQTDVEHRFEQYKSFLDSRELLLPAGDHPDDPTLAENPYGARSPREKRALQDGIPIFRLRYCRRSRSLP